MPLDKALVILRGQKVLKVDKFDYTLHPESKKLVPCKAVEHMPMRSKHTETPISKPEKEVVTEETLITPNKPPKPTKETKPKFEAVDISDIF